MQVSAGTCEDKFNQPAEASSIQEKDSLELTSVDGVSVDFLFDLRLDSLNFSTRVRNIFEVMDFTYIGDIVVYSERDFLSIDGLGKESLDEIIAKLSGLGLHLRMSVGSWSPVQHRIQKDKLDSRLDSLNFSTRVRNIFEVMDFTYIGDVVVYSERDFLSIDGLGRESLDEIIAKLSDLDLHLGMSVGNWSPLVLERETNFTAAKNMGAEQLESSFSPLSSLTKEETTEKMGGGNKAISPEDVNNTDSLEFGRSSLNPDFQRENVSISGRHLIKIRESVFFTPEFNNWFNKKNKLHSNSKMKVMNIVERFKKEGVDGLGGRWNYVERGLLKLSIASGGRGELRIYFTIKSDNLYLIFGEKASDSMGKKISNTRKAVQLIEKYFPS